MGAGFLLLLLAIGIGSRGKGGGNGANGGNGGNGGNGNGYAGGPAGVGPIPNGTPPGGCRLAFTSPMSTLQAMNLLGYTPSPQIWGPDEQLGTFDADNDPEIRQFQLDYNQGSRSKYLGNNAGGLMPDGMMGKCTMAAMAHVDVWVGQSAWRDRYMPRATLGGLSG